MPKYDEDGISQEVLNILVNLYHQARRRPDDLTAEEIANWLIPFAEEISKYERLSGEHYGKISF